MNTVFAIIGRPETWRRWLWAVVWCACGGAALAAPASGVFSEDLDAPLYDCQLTLQPAATLSERAAVHLTLESGEGGAETRVTITRQTIVIASASHGLATSRGSVAAGVERGAPYQLTILRRGDRLGILHGATLLFHAQVPRPAGTKGMIAADRGWTVDDARIQRLEPVAFSDDFMRTADEPGDWVTRTGTWGLLSAWDRDPHGNAKRFDSTNFAQNPFAWMGRAGKEAAICTTGKPYWEDYTFSTSVQPAANGAAGILCNMTDPRNGLLVRWSPGNDASATGNRLALYRYDNGTPRLLAESMGGYIPDQWYKLAIVSSLDGVRVLVDGQERLAEKGVTPWRGGIGLYTEGPSGAVFDDVAVYGRTLKTDLLRENQQARINQRYQEDKNGMQEWAAKGNEWGQFDYLTNHFFSRDEYLGEHWLSLNVHMNALKTGELWLTLHNDGKQVYAGYRAVLTRTADMDGFLCTLYRDTKELAVKKHIALKADEDYSFRLRQSGDRVWLERDGDVLLEARDSHAPAGMRAAYCGYGCFGDVRDIQVIGRNTLDYTFTDAPTDWVQQGTWMPSMRWACSPQWSFLGGWSRGDAALWHKNRFSGDQAIKAFVGPKMEYPRERVVYDYHYHDFGITLCGDGHDPRSGYAAIYGAAAADGTPNKRTVLLRNGVEVGAVDDLIVPGRGTAHRQWFALSLRKRGGTVDFLLNDKVVITYTDPHPIDGGVPAVWTNDNGIMLARVRLDYAAPPRPRTDPTVTIDTPAYPEWADVDHPLPLDFSTCWSTAGKPVHLDVTAKEIPHGSESAVSIDGAHATFLPREIGNYWYQICATDGSNTSQCFHLALPAYKPALGRDDSHALVLYRFDEGKGAVVHDHAKAAPAADLTIPDDAPVQWLAGRGLTLHGPAALTTAVPPKKLLALAAHQACTLEAWISTDTLYPPSGWSGCLFTWEKPGERQNISLLHFSASLAVAPHVVNINGNPRPFTAGNFHTGLSHLVVTWDGTTTTCYIDGTSIGTSTMAWGEKDWNPDALLQLGTLADAQRYYLGTYYLLAIHDVCFTPEQVTRHYQAGPDGR